MVHCSCSQRALVALLSQPGLLSMRWPNGALLRSGCTDVDRIAQRLWRAAGRSAGLVDPEVTLWLALAARHLLGREDESGTAESSAAASRAAEDAIQILKDQRPTDLDQLARIAWALSELELVSEKGSPSGASTAAPANGFSGEELPR